MGSGAREERAKYKNFDSIMKCTHIHQLIDIDLQSESLAVLAYSAEDLHSVT